jgi:hypothetical protein
MYFKLPYATGDLPSPPNEPGISDMAVGMIVLDPKTGSPASLGTPSTGAAPGNPQTGVSSNGIVINQALKVGTGGTDVVVKGGVYKNSVTIKNIDSEGNSLYISFTPPAGLYDTVLAKGESITLPFGPINDLYGISSGAGGETCEFTVIGA